MSDVDISQEDRNAEYTTVRLHDAHHARLKRHNRDGEYLSGTVNRALDALEREEAMPDAVTRTLKRSRTINKSKTDVWTHSGMPEACPECGETEALGAFVGQQTVELVLKAEIYCEECEATWAWEHAEGEE